MTKVLFDLALYGAMLALFIAILLVHVRKRVLVKATFAVAVILGAAAMVVGWELRSSPLIALKFGVVVANLVLAGPAFLAERRDRSA